MAFDSFLAFDTTKYLLSKRRSHIWYASEQLYLADIKTKAIIVVSGAALRAHDSFARPWIPPTTSLVSSKLVQLCTSEESSRFSPGTYETKG